MSKAKKTSPLPPQKKSTVGIGDDAVKTFFGASMDDQYGEPCPKNTVDGSEILHLHRMISKSSHYLQGLIYPRWCRISSINSMHYKST